jgi:hypothetical protein
MSLERFWTKRSPTRIAGTSIAAITSINSRVRRLIGASFRAQISDFAVISVTFGIYLRGSRSGNTRAGISPRQA